MKTKYEIAGMTSLIKNFNAGIYYDKQMISKSFLLNDQISLFPCERFIKTFLQNCSSSPIPTKLILKRNLPGAIITFDEQNDIFTKSTFSVKMRLKKL